MSEFKYFFEGTNFRPFVKANVGYKYKDFWSLFGSSVPWSDAHGLAFGGGVGGAFFVRNNISVDLGLQYLHSIMKSVSSPPPGPYTANLRQFTAKGNDVKVFVGFSVYL